MAKAKQDNSVDQESTEEVIKVDQESTEEVIKVDQESTEELCHRVAKGKSITTKRGVKGEGEVIEADHLQGGQDTLNNLVTRGLIKKG